MSPGQGRLQPASPRVRGVGSSVIFPGLLSDPHPHPGGFASGTLQMPQKCQVGYLLGPPQEEGLRQQTVPGCHFPTPKQQ